MVVKQAKWYAIALIVLGGVLTGVRIWLLMVSGSLDFSAILAPFLLLIGVLALINPTLIYENGVLQVRNLFGMTLRRYGRDELSVEHSGDKRLLFAARPGGRRRRRMMSAPPVLHDKAQAAALIDRIEAEIALS